MEGESVGRVGVVDGRGDCGEGRSSEWKGGVRVRSGSLYVPNLGDEADGC